MGCPSRLANDDPDRRVRHPPRLSVPLSSRPLATLQQAYAVGLAATMSVPLTQNVAGMTRCSVCRRDSMKRVRIVPSEQKGRKALGFGANADEYEGSPRPSLLHMYCLK